MSPLADQENRNRIKEDKEDQRQQQQKKKNWSAGVHRKKKATQYFNVTELLKY